MKNAKIEEKMDKIVQLMNSFGVQSLVLGNEGGKGITLNTRYPKGDEHEGLNFCIDVLYSSLNADDCFSRAWNLPSEIKDADDWKTLYDEVKNRLRVSMLR